MRTFLIFFAGAVCGGIAGAGAMLIAFPYLFPPPEVNESVNDFINSDTSKLILSANGQFREGVEGQDAVHWGRGSLRIYQVEEEKFLMEFQENFEVGPGPNFWIYLNTSGGINTEQSFLEDSSRIRLAKLKSFTGSQVYPVTQSDISQASSVTIWCESFDQYIASADLQQSNQ